MNELLQQIINGITLGGIYTLVAVGLSMIFGIVNIINFAHGEFYMIGAYLALIVGVTLGLPVALVMAAGIIGGGLLGYISEKLVFKPIRNTPHVNSIVVSMGLSIILANGAISVFTPTPKTIPPLFGTGVVNVFGTYVSVQRLCILLISVILISLLTFFVERTWMGMAMRSVAQDQTTARLMGINIDTVSSVTFIIGTALAAVSGILVGSLFVIEPHMGGVIGLKAFAVVILGGVGSIPGAIVAGMVLGVSETLAAGYLSTGLKDLVAFAIMIGVLLFRPSGIWGRKKATW